MVEALLTFASGFRSVGRLADSPEFTSGSKMFAPNPVFPDLRDPVRNEEINDNVTIETL